MCFNSPEVALSVKLNLYVAPAPSYVRPKMETEKKVIEVPEVTIDQLISATYILQGESEKHTRKIIDLREELIFLKNKTLRIEGT